MNVHNLEVVLDNGTVIYVDFTAVDKGKFLQEIDIKEIRTEKGNIVHLLDVPHISTTLMEQVDEYLAKQERQARRKETQLCSKN